MSDWEIKIMIETSPSTTLAYIKSLQKEIAELKNEKLTRPNCIDIVEQTDSMFSPDGCDG